MILENWICETMFWIITFGTSRWLKLKSYLMHAASQEFCIPNLIAVHATLNVAAKDQSSFKNGNSDNSCAGRQC